MIICGKKRKTKEVLNAFVGLQREPFDRRRLMQEGREKRERER